MATQVRNGLDLVRTALLNALLHPVGSDPSSPVDGQIWYRTDTDRFRVRANGVTQDLAFMADITGGAITGALWDAQSYIKAISDNTPVVQVVAAGELMGRPLGGDIGVVTAAQARSILNVEDGATADQSAAEILAALLTVDGSGSGLDADTLDGTQLAALATIAYVDSVASGLSWKASVRAATTANITLSGAQTIDGVSVIAGDRVLVKAQTTGSANGIYVAAAGAWSRAVDADVAAELLHAAVMVREGTTQADTAWVCTNDAITLGTTSLVFAQFGAGATYSAGAGLNLAGTVFSIPAGAVTTGMLAFTPARKFTATIGDGSATAIAVTHNFGTRAVTWSIRDVATNEFVLADVVATSTNAVTVTFATAPTSGQFEVTVAG